MKTLFYDKEDNIFYTPEKLKDCYNNYIQSCDLDDEWAFDDYLYEVGKRLEEIKVKSVWKVDTGERKPFNRFYMVFTDRTEAEGSFDDAIKYARAAGYNKASGGQILDWNRETIPAYEAVIFDYEVEA